jgi:hypothetical protein
MQWLKKQLEKIVNSIVDTHDLTDLQVWGCCFGCGVLTALLLIWIYLMHKGLHWDDVTKKVYPWDELIKLLRERDDNTIGVFKKEK